jgi:ABC-type glutathione transport system ATPase component
MTSMSVTDRHQGGPLDEGLLEVNGLIKHFPVTRGVLLRHKVGAVQAVDGVSFSVAKGETLWSVSPAAARRPQAGC